MNENEQNVKTKIFLKKKVYFATITGKLTNSIDMIESVSA